LGFIKIDSLACSRFAGSSSIVSTGSPHLGYKRLMWRNDSMTRLVKTVLLVGVAALAATAASAAYASTDGDKKVTPPGFSYDIKDGKRVPKTNRVTNADGSWREENKKGGCSEVKEMSASGELKITRKCD
jgi:hypothetical protein